MFRTLILRCRQGLHADLTTRLPALGVGVDETRFGVGRSPRNRCELGSPLWGLDDMVESRIVSRRVRGTWLSRILEGAFKPS